MTDEQLLARLAETTPEEWTSDELDLLRSRMQHNAELRAAFTDFVLLEQALTTSLSEGRITPDQVLARLEERRRGLLGLGRWWRTVAAIVLLAGGFGLWYSLREPAEDDPKLPRHAQPTGAAPQPGVKPVGPRSTSTVAVATPSSTPTATSTATTVALVPTPPTVGTLDPAEPWTAMLAAAERPFQDWCFTDRRLSRDAENLPRWWNTIRGQQRPVTTGDRQGLYMEGFFQLRAPWPAAATLSLWMYDTQNDRSRLCFWHGDQGLTLEYRTRGGESWTAYASKKKPNEPLPETFNFAATDHERHRRTGYGPIDFRFHDGRLFVSRGDILFFSAPMPGPPDTVVFEGTSVCKGMGLSNVGPLPTRWLDDAAGDRSWNPTETPRSIEWPTVSAAGWKTELPAGATFAPHGADGGTLSVSATTKPSWAALPSPSPGMVDLAWEIEVADRQTGVYLGDADGRPRYAIGFFQEADGGPMHVAQGRPNDLQVRYKHEPKLSPAPIVQFPAKLRLVLGAGTLKVYASVDGRSWGRLGEVWRGIDGPLPTIGIYANPTREKHRITITRIRHQPLLAAEDLQPPHAQAADGPDLEVPPIVQQGGFGLWFVDALDRHGDERPLPAYAANLLARGIRYDLARMLSSWVAVGAMPQASDEPPASRTQTLNRLHRLAWGADGVDSTTVPFWQQRYSEALAAAPVDDADEVAAALYALSPYSRVRRALVESPLVTQGKQPVFPVDLVREEILLLMRDQRWDALDQLCRMLHYFGGREDSDGRRSPPREPIMTLVDWAAATAERRRPAPEGATAVAPQTVLKSEWRHPLIEQFGKEGYNVLAELEIALAERAYVDACRIITSVTAVQAVGLLPNAGDADLLVSLPGAVALAMRDHPELRTVMQREYGDLAQLRLRQASNEGDVAAVQALTTQFFGTVAAAEAQMWLGDRALAQGDAARAEGHYQAARAELTGGDIRPIDARLRLAAALQGRNFGDPPTSSVVLGELTLSPAEFERTVSELRARAPEVELGAQTAGGATGDVSASPLPMPSRFKTATFAKIEGDLGKAPEQVPRRDVDYLGAQTSLTFAGERMIFANRFQITAYELKDKKFVWRAGLGGEAGRTYQLPLVPMPPIVVEDRIFARRLTAAGPELVCLRTSDGAVQWRSPRGDVVASDPLIAADRVLAVTLTLPQTDVVEAVLTMFDRRTGKVLLRRPLMQLRDYWKRELPCHLISAGDMLVVSLGGCVVGASGEGEPRWLRRLTWVPPSVDSMIGPTYPMPPQFIDGSLVVVQPNCAFAKQIDVRTGAVRGRSPVFRTTPEAEGFIVPAARRLTHGMESFRVEETIVDRKWHRAWAAWAGDTQGYATVAWPSAWQNARPAVGPLASHDGRYFAVVGTDLKLATREIVELIPGEPIESESPEVFQVDRTLRRELLPPLSSSLEQLTRNRSPWILVQSRYDEKLWFKNPLFLQDDCRLTSAVVDQPAIWTRRVSLNDLNPQRLHLRVAAAGTEPWQLTVRIDGAKVHEQRIAVPTDAAKPWVDVDVDLVKYSGRDVRLTLLSEAVPGGKSSTPVLAAWKQMEVVER